MQELRIEIPGATEPPVVFPRLSGDPNRSISHALQWGRQKLSLQQTEAVAEGKAIKGDEQL